LSLQILRSDKELEQAIKNGVALVAFNAPWCAPCQSQESIIIHLSDQLEQKALFAKIDIESSSGLATRLGIQAIPTVIIYKNSKEIQRFTGVHEESALRGALENILGRTPDAHLKPNAFNEKDTIMSEDPIMSEDQRIEAATETHKPARPMKFFKDMDGNGWLCDKDIDPKSDFEKQGCWRCEDMAFPAGGR